MTSLQQLVCDTLSACRQRLRLNAISKQTGRQKHSVERALRQLIDDGVVVVRGNGFAMRDGDERARK